MTGQPPTPAGDPRSLSELGLPLLLVLTGTGLLRATVGSDMYLRYVKEGLWPYLVASGVLLVLLGLAGIGAEVARRLRQPVLRRDASGRRYWHHPADGHAEGHDDHGHGHGGATRVAWLLAVPALTLLFVAPPALGSYTASRDGATARVERTGYEELADAPTTPMALEEFIGRSMYDSMSLRGRKIRVLGFVTAGRTPDTWYLNRLKVGCCAGDARTLRVEMHGFKAPADDTWVEVTGVWQPGEVTPDKPVPTMEVGALKSVAQPRNPYQDAPPTDG
ncbi:TIGR03943 family protein [Streptomyces sp. CC208A]|uniref:TIGR03943 family putative permease subunit n=1 Tax=Streptomyces sp. CC208A TaxID=3044573 RepID=UPI0024A8FC0C|nr:TIGR03943 family protein [Streptomyces sp. CC208A]